MAKLSSLSVFFPAFNEAKNLPTLVEQTFNLLTDIAQKYEVIIVNDGSVDNTVAVVEKLKASHPQLRLISHPKNLGYGAALRTGINHSQYDWVFFSDADLQFDIKELTEFLPYTADHKVIIGYRISRAEGARRHLNALLLKVFIDLLFRLHVKDIDCAFKLFDRKLVQSIKLTSTGAFISSELLYKLKKKQVIFKQLPVSHYQRRFGNPTGANLKVIIKAGLEMLSLYLSIKWSNLKNLTW